MGIIIPVFRDRDSHEVDRVIGRKREVSAAPQNIDWSKCPLALRHPSWDLFLEQLADERADAKANNRPAHPRAAAPLMRPARPLLLEGHEGLSVTQINRIYGSKD